MTAEALAYQKHMNLRLAAQELGMSFQTLYFRLRKQGVAVVGDKSRYGAAKDKLGALGEQYFASFVPCAKNMNGLQFQAKHDFEVAGQKVDVKASKPNPAGHKSGARRWAFAFKRQTYTSDFHVCFCLHYDATIAKTLLIPTALVEGIQTVSVAVSGQSKWLEFEVTTDELTRFFVEEVAA